MPLLRGVDGNRISVGTTTADILTLADWLTADSVTHVPIESTGIYWQPIFNLLEARFTVWVLNAQHVKNVSGRKTDVNDTQWLCDLLRHGLVHPSFIPAAQRDLRGVIRERTNVVRPRATLINQGQEVSLSPWPTRFWWRSRICSKITSRIVTWEVTISSVACAITLRQGAKLGFQVTSTPPAPSG